MYTKYGHFLFKVNCVINSQSRQYLQFLICLLFNDAVSSLDSVALDYRIIGKVVERSGPVLLKVRTQSK